METTPNDNTTLKSLRIGLALSGGGFRASIFHLGVIRRLEELGVMKHVNTISGVSGGAIIAAYYVVEMEKRLCQHQKYLKKNPCKIDKVRLKIFKEIAGDFFKVIALNLRSRAMLFSPFCHPWLFIKSLWPSCSRSDIMQKEYDRRLFDDKDKTLKCLPKVTSRDNDGCSEEDARLWTRPEVILNTTSLHTGKRIEFKRDQNTLKLSRVVGASSGVPGFFPPTTICGKKLVDGGVADNQGIDALISLDRSLDDDQNDTPDFDVLLVSDASGQMEQVKRPYSWFLSVLFRVVTIFQFQLRRKMLKLLRFWEKNDESNREFAFVHLFLDLEKDGGDTPCVPSKYIPALGDIRTDLDQFSIIEWEALMYHGYTLIDAQIQKYCCKRLKECIYKEKRKLPELAKSPLFKSDCTERRKRLKNVLKAGSSRFFLYRSWRKHPLKSWIVFAPAILLSLGVCIGLYFKFPNWAQWVIMTFWVYFVWFLTYLAMRRMVKRWDIKVYKSLIDQKNPIVPWSTNDAS